MPIFRVSILIYHIRGCLAIEFTHKFAIKNTYFAGIFQIILPIHILNIVFQASYSSFILIQTQTFVC